MPIREQTWRRWVVAFYSFFVLPFSFSAQEPLRFDSSTTIDIVSVPVTVTNRAGRFVPGLTAADFEITDDGARRSLTQFSAERVPVSLGILLDVSGSMATDPKARAIDDARWADTRRALELLVTRLDPRDQVLIAFFNDNVTLGSAWTQEHRRILSAFNAVRPAGRTELFDAVAAIAPAFQLAQHARKVLLVISDGQDSKVPTVKAGAPVYRYPPTQEQQVQAGIYQRQMEIRNAAIGATAHAVKTSEASVYAVGMGTRKGAYVNLMNLEALAAGTGGYVEAIKEPSEISAAVARICEELQAQYLLVFEPARADGKYHAISVRTQNRDLRVRAKAGYLAAESKK